MFRSFWELEAHARHRNQDLADERKRIALIDLADGTAPRLLIELRRRSGIGLIRIGTAIAGSDALRGVPPRPAWPGLAHR